MPDTQDEQLELSGTIGFMGRILPVWPLQAVQCAYDAVRQVNYFNLFVNDGTMLGVIEGMSYGADGRSAHIEGVAVCRLLGGEPFLVQLVADLTVDAARRGLMTVTVKDGNGVNFRAYDARGSSTLLRP